MKKGFLTIILVTFSIVTYLSAKTQFVNVAPVSIESVEVMEKGEVDNGHWMVGQTVRCKLELGGGFFTSSVMRVCVLADYVSNCTGAACGEAF